MHDDPARTLTAESESLDPARPARVAVLAIADHPEPGRVGETIALDRGEVPIDRGTAVFPGGPLADPSLSRTHARVRPDPDGGWVIVDAGSKNGTFVDEHRVSADGTPLGHGSVVREGEAVLVVLLAEAVPAEDADFPEIA